MISPDLTGPLDSCSTAPGPASRRPLLHEVSLSENRVYVVVLLYAADRFVARSVPRGHPVESIGQA